MLTTIAANAASAALARNNPNQITGNHFLRLCHFRIGHGRSVGAISGVAYDSLSRYEASLRLGVIAPAYRAMRSRATGLQPACRPCPELFSRYSAEQQCPV